MRTQPINCLPPVSIPSGTYFLPLSPVAASLLAESLLSPERLSLERIMDVLVCDPPLAIWLLMSASQKESIDSIRELGLQCLSSEMLDRLDWDSRSEGWNRSDEWDPRACAMQSALTLERLNSAANGDVLDSKDAMVELVSEAQLWLRKSGCTGDLEFSELPGRLQFLIDSAITPTSTSLKQPSKVALAGANSHWCRVESISEMLPRIAEQARGLRDLKRDYASELEREKLAAIKELAYGASHEINNPLANIATRAQTLLMDEVDPKRQRALAAINRQSFRAHEMIADLMLFAKPPRLEMGPVDPVEILGIVTEELATIADECDCKILIDVVDDCPHVQADAVQLGVVLQALVRNSLEALKPGDIRGQVTIVAEPTPDRSAVVFRVADNGPGISPEIRRHLFDPFFSGREAGRGLGFGLAKAWRIVDEHGGTIEVDSSGERCGTEVIVQLPRRKCS